MTQYAVAVGNRILHAPVVVALCRSEIAARRRARSESRRLSDGGYVTVAAISRRCRPGAYLIRDEEVR